MLKMAIFSVFMRSGLFHIRAVRNLMFCIYFRLKRRYRDIYHDLVESQPQLFRGGHILDVGANIGYTSRCFAQAVSPGFRVHAFEPAPANFELLQDCIATYRNQAKITPTHAAVGDRDGTISLELNRLNHTAHRVTDNNQKGKGFLTVPLLSLDSYCRSHDLSPIKFVKLDVEGHELFVCRGLQATMLANPELVLGLEFGSSSQADVSAEHQLLELLSAQSLKFYTAHHGELRPCTVTELRDYVERRETIDVLASRLDLV